MKKYTESIRVNANKTEKEQLVSFMEKFKNSLNIIYDEQEDPFL